MRRSMTCVCRDWSRSVITGEVDSIEHDVDARPLQTQSLSHYIRKIVAGRDECIHLRSALGQGLPANRPMGLRQRIQKRVLALESTDDWSAQFGFKPPRLSQQQSVRQTD